MKKPRLFPTEDFARGEGLAYVNFLKEKYSKYSDRNFEIDVNKYVVRGHESEMECYYYAVLLNGEEVSEQEFNHKYNATMNLTIDECIRDNEKRRKQAEQGGEALSFDEQLAVLRERVRTFLDQVMDELDMLAGDDEEKCKKVNGMLDDMFLAVLGIADEDAQAVLIPLLRMLHDRGEG